MAEAEAAEQWVPRVRRVGTADVGEKGKMAFIRSLIGERRFDEAAVELQTVLDTNPRSYIANIQMGRLLEHGGQFDLAVERFETARAANPTQAEAAAHAGGAYLRLKDYDRAREAFDAALKLDPKRATVPSRFGTGAFSAGRTRASQDPPEPGNRVRSTTEAGAQPTGAHPHARGRCR